MHEELFDEVLDVSDQSLQFMGANREHDSTQCA